MEEIKNDIRSWMDNFSYPFENREDLTEDRRSWNELKDAAEEAYWLLKEINEKLTI